ncbi:MAG TPA: cysteine desulfurase [Bacteroidales bacterium]|nr:cysteine desulfurase [Bacteroidales bacterium]
MSYNVNKAREDFPILKEFVYGYPLVYLDNAATTHKPQKVIDTVYDYMSKHNSSIHRGIHYLSDIITEEYENARKKVQEYIHARHPHEIIFTSGTTGSINGIAFSFGERYVSPGDEIIITAMEHHANIVPWQMMCQRKNAMLKVIPITDDGNLVVEEIEKQITGKTRLLSLTHISNVLGTINPVEEIISVAHRHNVPVLIDAAQSVQHIPIDVEKMDCDFLAFSGHKMYGPTGIGILYGKERWLEEIPPFHGGGDMVDIVTFEKTTYNQLPLKFEAGTTNFIGAIGLGTAIDYINSVGLENIGTHEHELLDYATRKISEIGEIKIYGNSKHKSAVISFLIGNIHQLDAGMIMDKMGVAVRTGTHCAQPLMQRFGIKGTIRASFALFNTMEEIDVLCAAIRKVKDMFG